MSTTEPPLPKGFRIVLDGEDQLNEALLHLTTYTYGLDAKLILTVIVGVVLGWLVTRLIKGIFWGVVLLWMLVFE